MEEGLRKGSDGDVVNEEEEEEEERGKKYTLG